jgi:hypothetical protein
MSHNVTRCSKDGACVRILKVFLILLNVIMLVGPVLGVILVYQNDLKGMVVTPQVESIMSGGSFMGEMKLPQFVSATPDLDGRTVTLAFKFTNPFDYDLMVKSISADIECSAHEFVLGSASLVEATDIPAGETVELQILASWTEAAEAHFNSEHAGATSIDAKVVNLKINVNDITVESDEAYPISVPTGGPIELPEFVSATPDVEGHTVTIVLNYANNLDYDLMINSISADVECSLHGFTLGHATLVSPVNIPAGTTSEVTIRCDWTDAAVDHFHTEHTGASHIAAKVVNISIDVNGITVQSDQAYPIDVPIS